MMLTKSLAEALRAMLGLGTIPCSEPERAASVSSRAWHVLKRYDDAQ
jgi:hypothetical protein